MFNMFKETRSNLKKTCRYKKEAIKNDQQELGGGGIKFLEIKKTIF